MMKQALIKIAEGYRFIQEGYAALAESYCENQTEEKAKTEDTVKEQKQEKEIKPITVEEVRAVLAAKSRDGKTQEVRELLDEFGAEKLSCVSKEKLPDLLQKAEVL